MSFDLLVVFAYLFVIFFFYVLSVFFFFFNKKPAYEMRISDWISDVCSSDLDDAMAANPDDSADQGASTDTAAAGGQADASGQDTAATAANDEPAATETAPSSPTPAPATTAAAPAKPAIANPEAQPSTPANTPVTSTQRNEERPVGEEGVRS